jgi:DNA invertase Pin-like site-specific DNA recombinase
MALSVVAEPSKVVQPARQAVTRVGLYARVSTSDQTAGMQLAELRTYCGRRSWTIVGEFVDEGISGSKESRPALDRLLIAARSRGLDVVLVYKFDRFARSMKQLVNTLCEFDSIGVQFVSVHEQIDTSSPNGRLMFGIFSAFAEFERELIRERTRSGMVNAKARGVHCGRKISINVDTTKVRALRSIGCSWDKIAVEVGCSRATVQRRAKV